MRTAQTSPVLKDSPDASIRAEHDGENLSWSFNGIGIQHHLLAAETGTVAISHATPAVFLLFCIGSNCRISGLHENRSYPGNAGSHNFIYAHNGTVQVNAETVQLELLAICFPADMFLRAAGNGGELLRRFAGCIRMGTSALLNDLWGANNLTINQIIADIHRCPHRGDLQNIYLTAKCLELLVLCATACCYARKQKAVYLKTQTDKQKIMRVRELIDQRIDQPPRLEELAKTVGLNGFKLKSGFKEIFNMSVFHYLTKQRLGRAHQYLRETDLTAAEIAYKLGYGTPQHFSYMFKKHYGYTPNQVKASYKDLASVLVAATP